MADWVRAFVLIAPTATEPAGKKPAKASTAAIISPHLTEILMRKSFPGGQISAGAGAPTPPASLEGRPSCSARKLDEASVRQPNGQDDNKAKLRPLTDRTFNDDTQQTFTATENTGRCCFTRWPPTVSGPSRGFAPPPPQRQMFDAKFSRSAKSSAG